ncbi:hypothetical protein GOODEAATRI_028287, partial [Goodea atripinnis]
MAVDYLFFKSWIHITQTPLILSLLEFSWEGCLLARKQTIGCPFKSGMFVFLGILGDISVFFFHLSFVLLLPEALLLFRYFSYLFSVSLPPCLVNLFNRFYVILVSASLAVISQNQLSIASIPLLFTEPPTAITLSLLFVL